MIFTKLSTAILIKRAVFNNEGRRLTLRVVGGQWGLYER